MGPKGAKEEQRQPIGRGCEAEPTATAQGWLWQRLNPDWQDHAQILQLVRAGRCTDVAARRKHMRRWQSQRLQGLDRPPLHVPKTGDTSGLAGLIAASRKDGGRQQHRFAEAEAIRGPASTRAWVRLELHVDACRACRRCARATALESIGACARGQRLWHAAGSKRPEPARTRGRPFAFLHRLQCDRCRRAHTASKGNDPVDWSCPFATVVEVAEAGVPTHALQRHKRLRDSRVDVGHKELRKPTKVTVPHVKEPRPVARVYKSIARDPMGTEAVAIRNAVEASIQAGKARWLDDLDRRVSPDGRVDTAGLTPGSIAMPMRVDQKLRPGVRWETPGRGRATTSLEQLGEAVERGEKPAVEELVPGMFAKTKARAILGAHIDLNPCLQHLGFCMDGVVELRDAEEVAGHPRWRGCMDYAGAFEQMVLHSDTEHYYRVAVVQPAGTARVAALTSPGFGASTTPMAAELLFSALDEAMEAAYPGRRRRYVDDIQLFGANEADVSRSMAAVARLGAFAGFPIKAEKTVGPTMDPLPFLGLEWTDKGPKLPEDKRRRLVAWLYILSEQPELASVEDWCMSLGTVGYAAMMSEKLRALTPLFMKGLRWRDGQGRGRTPPAGVGWALGVAVRDPAALTDPDPPHTTVRTVLGGSDASDTGVGWGIEWGEGGTPVRKEAAVALGGPTGRWSSTARELLGLLMTIDDVARQRPAVGQPAGGGGRTLLVWCVDNSAAASVTHRRGSSKEVTGLVYMVCALAAQKADIELLGCQVPRESMTREDALSRVACGDVPPFPGTRRPATTAWDTLRHHWDQLGIDPDLWRELATGMATDPAGNADLGEPDTHGPHG